VTPTPHPTCTHATTERAIVVPNAAALASELPVVLHDAVRPTSWGQSTEACPVRGAGTLSSWAIPLDCLHGFLWFREWGWQSGWVHDQIRAYWVVFLIRFVVVVRSD
jgi:hypothetical protein